jgi:hypothetical protein
MANTAIHILPGLVQVTCLSYQIPIILHINYNINYMNIEM